MEQVIIRKDLLNKLDELVRILFEDGYFNYYEAAEEYVDNIRIFIKSIPQQSARPTAVKTHGAWYCKYKPNKHTTWYITFDTDGETWLIKNILNNHTKDYPRYIRAV